MNPATLSAALYSKLAGGTALTTLLGGTAIYRQQALKHLGHSMGDFPVTDRHALEMITLPLDQYLTTAQLDEVISVVSTFYEKA